MNIFQKIKTLYAPFRTRVQYFFQNKMTKKRYLFCAFFCFYAATFVYYGKQYPKEMSLYVSKGMEKISEYYIP